MRGGLAVPSEASACQSPWEEDTVEFLDTDGDTNMIRLQDGAVDVEVNRRRLFHDVVTCRIDGHTLQMQTASSKTVVMTVPQGREELVLRVMALMQRRHEASSIVEFHDAHGRETLMRISPMGCLQLFLNGKLCLSDMYVCRLDGAGGRSISIKGAAAKSHTSSRAVLTVCEEHQEVMQSIAKIFGKRGLLKNAVRFADSRGDVCSFQLTETATLELHLNGKLLDDDLVEVRVEGFDGRMIHCKGESSSAAIVMTVPSGMQDWAVCTLALFQRRVALRRGEQPTTSIFCIPSLESGRQSPSASKSVQFSEDGVIFLQDGSAPSGSSTSLASSTRCSAVSSCTSSRSSAISEEIGTDLHIGMAAVGKPATGKAQGSREAVPAPQTRSRKHVRHWLLRPPGKGQRDCEQEEG